MKKALQTLFKKINIAFKSILLLAGCFSVFITAFSQQDNFDFRILRQIAAHRTTAKNSFYKAVSNAASYVDYSLPVGIFITASVQHDKALQQKAFHIAESQLLTAISVYGIKHIVNRQRPAVKDPTFTAVINESDPSFPSGHTSEAFATATSLTIAFPKWYVIVPAYSWAITVSYSRLYLGVHYPTDVLAGAILGSGCAWLTYKVNKW